VKELMDDDMWGMVKNEVSDLPINLKVCYLVMNSKSTILCTNTSAQEKLKVVKI